MQDGIYFKFFPEDLTLREFKYSLGLNKDIHPFDSTPDICSKGGLYYTDIYNIEKFSEYGPILGIVKIPEGTPIVKVYQDKYKSPEIFIEEFILYEDFCKNKDLFLNEKRKNIKFMGKYYPNDLTKEMCLEAVKINGKALEYVNSEFQTEEICLEAVKKNGLNLYFVKPELRTEEICLEAVKNYGYALYYVNTSLQTEEMYLEAIKTNGETLRFIKPELQTEAICLEAVKNNGRALEYVKPEIQTEEICLEAVKNNECALYFIKDPSMKSTIKNKLNL